MTTSMLALLGFGAWTLLLVLLVVSYRGAVVMGGKRKADAWTRGRAVEDPALVQRIAHAHMNCVEYLPVFVAVILVAQVTGQAAVTNGLALWFLAARVAQSTVHVIAVNHWMVNIRFAFFLIQVAILVWWIIRLAGIV